MRPPRSALYVPASNARALAKARELPCDAVILDLEDAVAPEAKAAAREAAVAALAAGFGGRTAVLRVNAPDTPWHGADLAAARTVRPDAVLLPKVETAEDVGVCAEALQLARGVRIWAMVETPGAVMHLPEIASAAVETPLSGLVLGLNDLAAALGARQVPGRAPFLTALSRCVLAARAFGLLVLDSVFNTLDDPAGFEAECAQARDWGFDGKTLIHPGQIEAANRAFSPTEAELAWARAVTAAFADPANAGRAALRVQGALVEPLHLAQARRMLARAGAAG